MDRDLFMKPPAEYRPIIFWSWNGELDPKRMKRQIREMHAAGLGGFFMHARDGLKVPYMKEAWFERIKLCVTEAKRYGMEAWIYDENGWPSGFAGGEVPKQSQSFRAKALVMKPILSRGGGDCIGGLDDGNGIDGLDDGEYRLLTEVEHAGGHSGIYEWVQPLGHPRFEGASYVDLLHPGTTKAFLDSTHNRYEREAGGDFGAAIPGIFSDEPCALLWLNREEPALPWTDSLPSHFLERYGYSLMDRLPALFVDTEDSRQVRYDFWKLVVELLAVRFSKPIYDWCEQRGLKFTGHYMAEDRLSHTMDWIGDLMPHYEYMHIPGMDHLGRELHRHCDNSSPESRPFTTVMAAKQVTSAAHQMGKTRALSELFACAGQGFDPELQKQMTDWHLIHGINFFTPHLLPYTLEGNGKRDYPPTIGPQQPWWEYTAGLTDYQARISYALTRGERLTDTLLIHPVESAWECYAPLQTVEVDRINDQLEQLCLQLLDDHAEFDFGNEHLLEKYGFVEKGRIRMGNGSYRTAIIPCCSRLRSSTLALLQQLHDQGGRIIAWNAESYHKLAQRYPVLRSMNIRLADVNHSRCADTGGIAAGLSGLAGLSDDEIAMAAGGGTECVWMHRRRDHDSLICFLANLSLTEEVECTFSFHGRCNMEIWDGETGNIMSLPAVYVGERTVVDWSFSPGESLLLRAYLQQDNSTGSDSLLHASHTNVRYDRKVICSIAAEMKLTEAEYNAVVLDRFRLQEPGGNGWGETLTVSRLRTSTVPWTGPVRLSTAIAIDVESIHEPIYVATERSPRMAVYWDGIRLAVSETEWLHSEWLFYQVPVELLATGIHQVELELAAGEQLSSLENAILVGHFLVSIGTTPAIRNRDARLLNAADFIESGFPFFAGKLKLSCSVDLPEMEGEVVRWKLRLVNPALSAARPIWDGKPLVPRLWGPWEWEIPAPSGKDPMQLEWEVTNTLRNLLGPHYVPDDDRIVFLGPEHFSKEETDQYVLEPFRLGEAQLVAYIRDTDKGGD
ncbi:glycosyl hydrolase [Paenibacillus sp. GCM10027626]|uniref:glycosyl hydrolase n=1 Tax=Paenibacillus sp. GCM10027626 TaxID=3273411 RepID=UPI0036318990